MNVFIIALRAIFVNKMRSFLTMLGVIIGVASVVLLTSIGNGLSAFVTEQFNELGANTVLVFPGDVFGEGGGISSENTATSIANSKLTQREVMQLKRLREHVAEVAPFNIQSDIISRGSTKKRISILGTTANYETAFNAKPEKGRFFLDSEESSAERVIVLGYELAEELFGNVDPVGKRVSVGDQSFRVTGVIEKKGGGFGGPSFDTFAYMPLKTFFRAYDTNKIIRIIVKTKTIENLDEHMAAISKELEKSLDADEFSVVDQSEILGSINQILSVLTIALGGIASISLVVGGIGIMNIMLVSVTERTREIGLRKALGATPNLILLQFLIEAAILSFFGGMIGVAIAVVGTLALQAFLPAKVTFDAVLLAFGVSSLVGLVFGAAPARRAAKLSPIEALRYE